MDWSVSENFNSQEETIKTRTSKEEPKKRGRVTWYDVTLFLSFQRENKRKNRDGKKAAMTKNRTF